MFRLFNWVFRYKNIIRKLPSNILHENNKQKLQKQKLWDELDRLRQRNNGQCVRNTQIHTNKYIENFPNKPTTASMMGKHVWECAYTGGHYRVLEKANTPTFFYFNNIR